MEHRSEVVTDQSGRFGQGGMTGEPGGMSYGEQHNLDTELEKKALKRIAAEIGAIVAAEGHCAWVLAAPQPILKRLQEALPRPCREALADTVGADLTKEPIAKLEQRFVRG
ncbi:MAG: host attachment protein [Akkermansiaceae bacterium]|nr:host attachment protein [Akkermansiaceae bacterium]